MPRTSTFRALAAEVGTPFYCYSTATLERHYRRFRRGLRRHGRARLLCHEGEFEPGGACDLARAAAPAWTSSRRANCAGRSRPACPGERIVFSGVGKTRQRDGRRARPRHPLLQRRIRAGACGPVSRSPSRKGRQAPVSVRVNPDVDAKTHRKISTGKLGEQVRHPDRRRARGLCPGGGAAGHRGDRRRHAYRQPDHRPRTLRQRLCAARRARPRPDGRRPSPAPRRSRRRPRHSLSRTITSRRPTRRPMPRSSSAHTGQSRPASSSSRSAASSSAMPASSSPRVIYVKAGTAKTFVIVDAAMNDLIRPTLYDAHHDIRPVAEPEPGARAVSSPTWSARSANPATTSPSTASCRPSRPATCSRS